MIGSKTKDAYGPYRPELVMEIPREELPADLNPMVGQQLQSKSSDGSLIIVTVIETTATTITVDANHPLAGKDLTFEIKLLTIS